MVFLTGLATSVLKWLLPALGGWLLRHFQEMWKDYQEKKAAEGATQKAVDDLKNAKTPEELNNAAKGVADNL